MSNTTPDWNLAELLRRAGISDRAFRQMRDTGAVGEPNGKNRGARYGPEHLNQIRRVLYVQSRRDLTMVAACEFVSAETSSNRRSPAVQSKNRAAADLSFKGTVRRLMPDVFLVYPKELSSFERRLIDEVTLRFRSQLKLRQASAEAASDGMRSTVYRANRQPSGG